MDDAVSLAHGSDAGSAGWATVRFQGWRQGYGWRAGHRAGALAATLHAGYRDGGSLLMLVQRISGV